MTATGVGVLLLGIGFIVLSLLSILIIVKLSNLINSVNRSVEALPKQMNGIISESNRMIRNSNQMIDDLTEKSEALNPVVDYAGELGTLSIKPTSSLVSLSGKLKNKVDNGSKKVNPNVKRNAVGSILIGYQLFRKQKELKRIKQGTESYDKSN